MEASSTDITKILYDNENCKSHLMAVADLAGKFVPGWAVATNTTRKLALSCWKQVREWMKSFDLDLSERIIYHDQKNSVYTSY
jgi:hypothetical protein